MAKIELPECWAGVAEPLRAFMAEVEHEAHGDDSALPDLAAVSARWAQVRMLSSQWCGRESPPRRLRKRWRGSDSYVAILS